MKLVRVASVMFFMLCMFVTATHAQSVQTDFDRSFDFSKLRTFNFAVQQRTANDPLAQDPLNEGRIRAALESKLVANGFRHEGKKADFVVAYYVTTRKALNVQDYGYGPPRWFGRRDIRVDQYTEGTLTVDLIDATTHQLVWRGRASGTVDLKEMDKRVNKAVEKLVAKFLKDTRKK